MQLKPESTEPPAPVERVKIKEWHGPAGFMGAWHSRISTVDADKVPPGAEVIADSAIADHDWQQEERK